MTSGGDAGHTPLVTASGRRAVELLRERRPPLLITDLLRYDLDGAGLIDVLKPERTDRLRTILLSASVYRRHGGTADAVPDCRPGGAAHTTVSILAPYSTTSQELVIVEGYCSRQLLVDGAQAT